MKQVTLHIPDKNYPLFMEMAKNIKFIKKIDVEETVTSKQQILQDIKQAVEEVNLIKSRKLKGINAKDLLNEL